MESTLIKRISSWIDEHGSSELTFLASLIQEPSVQGNEAGAQKSIAKKFTEMGLTVDTWYPDAEILAKHPVFHSNRTSFDSSPNVVGVWQGTGGGRSIILNGHIDVVPEGDPSQWSDDPFSGYIVDGRVFGRGSSDMKGGIFSAILAVRSLQALNIRLYGDVILQSVVEEESGGAGTLSALLRGYRADACLIPEPTDMRIFVSQQGSMWFRIRVPGVSAHGGTRYEGVNAIEKGMYLIQGLQFLEKQRNDRMDNPLYRHFQIPIPINVGVFHAGKWPSSVPDHAVIEGRIGVGPHETWDSVCKEMEIFVHDWTQRDPWLREHPPAIEWFGARWMPSEIDVSHELTTSLVNGFRHVLGRDPIVEGAPWATDAGLFTHVGKIPSIVFGPGTTRLAHYPNESVAIRDLFDAAKVMAATLIEWCGVSSPR
ncbi:peptidase [Kyrpidia sp.]|uniref:peptidase n=1 Tax=Kyrpidia sp. TaxID=2073077 RepID=UPI0025854B04|nr:peptidase [Kyrpidia sp.]MCL6575050.1 peptidase [Kyrpidia sp.]